MSVRTYGAKMPEMTSAAAASSSKPVCDAGAADHGHHALAGEAQMVNGVCRDWDHASV